MRWENTFFAEVYRENRKKEDSMKKRVLLISSMLAIIICVALIVGSTVALLTSDTKIRLSVSSASLNVEAYMQDFKLFSAVPDNNGEEVDENGRTYSYKEFTEGTFYNGGTADVTEDGGLIFENLAPGDKVEFNINVSNLQLESGAAMRVKYKTVFRLVDQEINKLYDAFKFKVEIESGLGEVFDDPEEVGTYRLNNVTTDTGWKPLEVGESEVVKVTIALPLTAGNTYQNVSAKFSCTLCAIQSVVTDKVSGIAEVQGEDVMDLEEAVSRAKDGDVIEIVHGNLNPAGDITVDKNLTIMSADGSIYPFKDVRFNVINGVTFKVSDLQFTGDSYMNVSDVQEFELSNCIFKDVAPSKAFYGETREYLERAAIVVSDEVKQSGTVIKVHDNTFSIANNAAADTAAIYMGSALADGSYVSDNIIGKEEKQFDGAVIELLNVKSGANIAVENNRVYGKTALKLNQKVNRGLYTVNLADNVCVSAEENAYYIELVTDNRIALYDNGSKFNNAEVGFKNLNAPKGGLFFGINVVTDEYGILSGDFMILTDSVTDSTFLKSYASPNAETENIHISRAE